MIPVHKPDLSVAETMSLQACYRHLRQYDCFLVFPEAMPTANYSGIHPGLKLMPVPASWLSSVEAYNRMKLSDAFYRLFSQYDFMMTYELDAYVFSSAVAERQGFAFDFIGAPIFEGFMEAAPDAPFLNALNSGFSIRRIAACRQVLRRLRRYRLRWEIAKFFLRNFTILRRTISPARWEILYNGPLKAWFRGRAFNEDMIWTQAVPLLFPSFRVAPPETAARFAFEVHPERLYRLNGRQLPLGCHAWAKFFDFWKNHIDLPTPGFEAARAASLRTLW